MEVNLTAIIKSKPGFSDDLKSMLEHLVVNSRQEVTCKQYDMHQVTAEPDLFIFHEIWESEAALDAHNNQKYIKDFIANSEKILTEPVLIYKTIKI